MVVRSTSRETYRQINTEGLLKGRRLVVYNWLFDNGPATGSEVVVGVTPEGQQRISQDRARLNELAAQGCIAEVGTVRCSVTGREVIQWDVTDRLPSALPKKEKLMTKAELLARIAELEHRVSLLERG